MLQFDKLNLRDLDQEIQVALKVIAEKHGLILSPKSGSFSRTEFTYKVGFVIPDATGEAQSKEAEAFRLLAPSYRLKPEWLHKEFTYLGERYKIIGLNTKAHKKCINIVRTSDGKPLKCEPAYLIQVAHQLND